MRHKLAALLLLALPFAVACGAHASTTNIAGPQQRALQIERGLACPQCTDLALDVCDQEICNDMRAILQQRIAAGESDEAIRDYFVQRYGARVLLAPPKNSSTWFAWLMPLIGLLAGAAATAVYLRTVNRRQAHKTSLGIPAGLSSEYRARVERELRDVE